MSTVEFKLPELGEGIHEGEIVKWLVKPGDAVQEDQIIMEVQNDKAVVEIPSPVDGTVKDILVAEGAVAVVGDTLITFESVATKGNRAKNEGGAEKVEEVKAREENVGEVEPREPEKEVSTLTQSIKQLPIQSSVKGVLATPAIRKLAREKGINLAQVTGTGANGRITKEDLLAFVDGKGQNQEQSGQITTSKELQQVTRGRQIITDKQQQQRAEERIQLKGIRKAIAQAMSKSLSTAAHVTIMDEVDVSKLVQLRENAKPLAKEKGIKLTYLPFVVKSLVAAVRQFPELNSSLDEQTQEIVYKYYYHVGIATDTEKGLLVPVIFDADKKSIWQIAQEVTELAAKGREGKLSLDQLKGSTITISNIGSAGGMSFTPIINYPEVAILGMGRITEKPVVKEGEIQIAPMLALSISFDHRVIDGLKAQLFMNHVKQVLADPQLLLLEV